MPVDDIIVNARENDLILGTHGRSIIILDDISVFEKLTPAVLASEVFLFPPREAVAFYEKRSLPDQGAAEFSGPNPDYGALITYYLKDDPPKPEPKAADEKKTETPEKEEKPAPQPKVKITILDAAGQVVREIEGPDQKGFQRSSWDLQIPSPLRAEKRR